MEQANWVQTQMKVSDRHILLMDSSKMGQSALAHAADLTDIDVLVTDEGVDDQMRAGLAQAAPHLEVIYA